MTDTTNQPEEPAVEPKTLGMLAQFAGPDEMVSAARKMREKGYTRLEAFSPFPVHGIDEALAAPKPILPWVVFCAGFTGMLVGLGLQFYTNATEGAWPFSGYSFAISGKPAFSLPANIPVTFELIIAFSAFTSFFGMLAFNGLPRLYNPLFRSDAFLKATDDGFFLYADARDAKFDDEATAAALADVGGSGMEIISDDPTPATIPVWFHVIGVSTLLVGLIPLAYIAMSRGGTSETPRIALWIDMDYQPKVKPQRLMSDDIFADRRSMRLPVAGTVARGGLTEDYRLLYGVHPEEEDGDVLYLQEELGNEADDGAAAADDDVADGAAAADGGATADGDATVDDSAEGATEDEAAAATEQASVDDRNWVTEIPLPITNEMMKRGRQRYEIHCAPCHGLSGHGDGLVAQRAAELQQPTWIPPTSIHQQYLREMPVGQIYNTITNGKPGGKMAAYKEHVDLEDRWAITLYIRALQRSQYATPEDLSEEDRQRLAAMPQESPPDTDPTSGDEPEATNGD